MENYISCLKTEEDLKEMSVKLTSNRKISELEKFQFNIVTFFICFQLHIKNNGKLK